jgi:hypothetical protein
MKTGIGRARRSILGAATLALVAIACTGGENGDGRASPGSGATASDPAAEPTTAATSPPAVAASFPGRLLLISADGSLLTVRPDGTEVEVLAEGDPSQRRILQAAWAPDGSRVAWSEVRNVDGTAQPLIVSTDATGGDLLETPLDVAAFYLAWDPTSSRIAYLGNDDELGIGMGMVENEQGAAQTALAAGAPFYFSWAPEGDRLLTHVGDDRLDELAIDGTVERIGSDDAMFQAPAWSADGRSQVYAEARAGERHAIVVRDTRSGEARSVVTVDGSVSLVLSPDGSSLAVQSLNEDELDLYDRSLPSRAEGVGVRVIDLESGETDEVTRSPAVAFSWSPTGDRLAVLEPMYRANGPIYFRWVIWDGDDRIATAPFSPGFALLDQYAPFFTQYAQSVTMWSPDGSAFAYPVDRPSEPTSIWIQPVEAAALPFRVGTGSFVAWGPEPGR